jgi:trehalose 6-phosphate synthase/phosphatase
VEINKGKAVVGLMQDNEFDFIMAIGDDHTDEDIFKAMPQSAVTIKVGSHVSAARYYISDFVEVRKFLKDLTTNMNNNMSKDLPALNH